MSQQSFHVTEEPTDLSVRSLIRSLRIDSATKQVSAKSYAHRSRVIRQQTELVARKMTGVANETSKQLAKRLRKASRSTDHREEGGQG